AAECYQRKFARIVSALDGDDAQSPLHVGIHHAYDPRGELLQAQMRALFLQPLRRDLARSFEVECELAAQKTVRTKASHQQVGIGHGGLGSATVADWPRIGAGRFWSHAQRASGIEASQRAASGAHGVNLEHGNSHGKTSHLRLTASSNLTLDGGYIGRGPAH